MTVKYGPAVYVSTVKARRRPKTGIPLQKTVGSALSQFIPDLGLTERRCGGVRALTLLRAFIWPENTNTSAMQSPAKYLDEHSADLTDLLARLIEVQTVNPPGQDYDAMTTLLAREMADAGLSARRFQVERALLRKALPQEQWTYPRFNLLGRRRIPGAKHTIHFNAHYDVVPVSGNWRHESPFSGRVENGRIFGRGAADMKGSIASLLMALRALRATKTALAMNVEVSFTADEETDSVLGAEWLVKRAPIDPDFAVVMEGGEGSSICCGHNGVVWLEVVVHGKAAHGSKPEAGINALEKMSALVLALEEYKRRLGAIQFRTPDDRTMHPTLNIGGVFSAGPGGKINTVPAEARFSIDRRVLANETVSSAERDLRKFLAAATAKIPKCRISVNKISENHSCYSSPDDRFFGAMREIVEKVRRAPAKFSVSSGFNDMFFFAHHLGIPTVGYGPGGENLHAVDEFARVKDLVSAAKIYSELLTRDLAAS
jgi:succinyl-diaminopimelate desuccinylase